MLVNILPGGVHEDRAECACEETPVLRVIRCRMSARHSWSVHLSDDNENLCVVIPLLDDPGFVGLSLRGCEIMGQKKCWCNHYAVAKCCSGVSNHM